MLLVRQRHARVIGGQNADAAGIVADGVILPVNLSARSPQTESDLRILDGVPVQAANGVVKAVDTAVDGESVQGETP